MAMNNLHLANSFPNSFGQMNQNILHDITKTHSSRLDDQHIDSKIQTNVSFFTFFIMIFTDIFYGFYYF